MITGNLLKRSISIKSKWFAIWTVNSRSDYQYWGNKSIWEMRMIYKSWKKKSVGQNHRLFYPSFTGGDHPGLGFENLFLLKRIIFTSDGLPTARRFSFFSFFSFSGTYQYGIYIPLPSWIKMWHFPTTDWIFSCRICMWIWINSNANLGGRSASDECQGDGKIHSR